jgi:ParB family transcriptional regulator, chromosome partitioning protein
MAKRRRLEAPDAEALASLEAGFAAKPTPDRIGLTAPIAQVAAEIARLAEPLDVEKRVSNSRDSVDAAAWRQAQDAGRVILDLPLDAIDPIHLMRDRMVVDAEDLAELKASIRANGQRLPIEVTALEEPGPSGARYGLISGWRRLTVLQELAAEEGSAFATIKALVLPAHETGALYTAMVEENELRAQISAYERGRIAAMAAELGAFPDTETAINTIYAAASKAKRSKIRSFAYLHEELGDVLQHPTDLSERNGLRLAHALREGHGAALRHALVFTGAGGAVREWALIEPILLAAEAQDRPAERGGRPKRQFDKPTGRAEDLGGMTMERVLHEDGYSIRLRGERVDIEMVNLMMSELRHMLTRRFNWKQG